MQVKNMFINPELLEWVSNSNREVDMFKYQPIKDYPQELLFCDDIKCTTKLQDVTFSTELPYFRHQSFNRQQQPQIIKEGVLQTCPANYKDDVKLEYEYQFLNPKASNQTSTSTGYWYTPQYSQIIGQNFIYWIGNMIKVSTVLSSQSSNQQTYLIQFFKMQIDKIKKNITAYGTYQIKQNEVIGTQLFRIGMTCSILNENTNFTQFDIKGIIYIAQKNTSGTIDVLQYYTKGKYCQQCNSNQQDTTIVGDWGISYDNLNLGNFIFTQTKVPYPNQDIQAFEYIPFLYGDNLKYQTDQNILEAHFARRCRYDINKYPQCMLDTNSVCRQRFLDNKDNPQLNTLIHQYCKKQAPTITVFGQNFYDCYNNWNTSSTQYKQWKQQICSTNPTQDIDFKLLSDSGEYLNQIASAPPILTLPCGDQFDVLYSLLSFDQKKSIMLWIQTNKGGYTSQFPLQQQLYIKKFETKYQKDIQLDITIDDTIRNTQDQQITLDKQIKQQNAYKMNILVIVITILLIGSIFVIPKLYRRYKSSTSIQKNKTSQIKQTNQINK